MKKLLAMFLLLTSTLTLASTFNAVQRLTTGEDLQKERMRIVKEAKEYILIKTFILNADPTEQNFFDALCERSRLGLDVRILLDGMGSSSGGNPLEKKGGKYSVEWFQKTCDIRFEYYAPLSWGLIPYIIYSQHDKMTISDVGVITGGTNYSKDYSTHGKFGKTWYDFDIAVQGPAQCDYLKIFNDSWVKTFEKEKEIAFRFGHARKGKLAELDSRFLVELLPSECNVEAKGDISISVLYNNPMKNDLRPLLAYRQAMVNRVMHEDTEKVIRFYAPYFVPTKAVVAKLVEARKSGVRVQILTNSWESIDKEAGAAYPTMLNHVKDLLKNGVEIYLWQPTAVKDGKFVYANSNVLHKKGGCFGRLNCFVGSHNLDVRGDEYSSEMLNIIGNKSFVDEMIQGYDEDLKYAVELSVKNYKVLRKLSPWYWRIAARLAGWAI